MITCLYDIYSVRAAFNDGVLKIWGEYMPVFLYNDYTYNPDDPEEGLFQGAFLVCVLIDILFGTNSVDTMNVKREEQCRHHCVREMYDIVKISPQNIAFAAVVARFCLSSKRTWNTKDDFFNYHSFYQAIIMRLSDRDDPWVRDTLAWWNERVFGNERGKVAIVEEHVTWQQFSRRAERKAAVRAAEAKIRSMASASTPSGRQADSSNNRDGTDAVKREDAPGSPTGIGNRNNSIPFSPAGPILSSTVLLGTSGMDTSAVTPTPPFQTPDTSGHSHHHRDSFPLSNAPETVTPARTTDETPSLKRKRQVSTTDRPNGMTTSKARRRPA